MSTIPPWLIPQQPTPQSLAGARFLEALLKTPQRRKVFISYFKGDSVWRDEFVRNWGPNGEHIFTPKVLGVTEDDDFVDSEDSDYIMSRIRSQYLEDSSVTIVLIGGCTHSRRFVDWEIKSSLRQEDGGLPNGLMGILIPGCTVDSVALPPRFKANWVGKYAKLYPWPALGQNLRSWIEDANSSRTIRAGLIANPQEMLKYNRTCQAHFKVH